MKKYKLAVIFVIMCYSLVATTWTVGPSGCNYTTIQAAVDAASANDIIQVYEGEYNESIYIDSGLNGLQLIGMNGVDDCIISANMPDYCIESYSSIELLEGFTFTDANIGALRLMDGAGTITNCIFEGNYGNELGGAIRSWKSIEEISHCVFTDNSGYYTIYINTEYAGSNPPDEELFSDNLFYENSVSDNFYLLNSSNEYTGYIINNTFVDDGIYIVSPLSGNASLTINNCIFSSAGISHYNITESHVNISYTCFTNTGYSGTYNWGTGNLVSTNPQFKDASNDDYELEWDDTVKSPCIDTGDPNSALDPDGTRADMGVYYCDHDEETYTFTVPQGQQTGITWLSFDILDPTNATTNNQVQYFLEDIQDDLHNGEHEEIEFSYNVGPPPSWTNGDVLVTSPRGFKIRVTDDDDFDVSGFRCDATTKFDIVAEEDWIGYFLEDTQHIYDAFDGYLDDIASITHQEWSVRQSRGEWPDVGYTLSAGDMVIVECRSTIEDFSWPVPARTEPFIVLEPREYSYNEEMDYIPIYIDLDENDLPDEIGVFLDDECVGARVVQHDFENVCTYITDAQFGDIEIEFAYYDRGSRQRFKEYTVYDEETGYRETTTINLKEDKQEYYYISFNSQPGNNNTPQSNELTISNSPNPFNPSTSIYYNLPIEDHVQLSIYNLKGQKVKTLAEGTQPAGNYNVIWDGKDSTGKSVSSGVYFYQISTSSQTIKKKMLMLK